MRNPVLSRIGVLIICSMLGACTAVSRLSTTEQPYQPPPPAQAPPSPAVGKAPPAVSRPINITPFTTYRDQDELNRANGGSFTNSYTRIRISAALPASQAGDHTGENLLKLGYDPRNPVARFLVGRKFDAHLSVKVKTGAYEATIPLVTVSHQSTSDGERWSRVVSQQLLDFPLFLVRPDGEASIPTFQITMAGSREYSSSLAGTALESVIAGIQAVSPDSGVLTTLTAQSMKDKSRAVDTAIDKLFSDGLSEEHVAHRDLRLWNSAGGVRIRFQLPKDDGDWNADSGEVGSWIISFEEPRPSIFGDWRVCGENKVELRCASDRTTALRNVHRQLTPNQVLGYPLLKSSNELGTIAAFLMRQDWYAKSMSEFSGDAANDAALADEMCLRIQNSIVALGLNSDDADIVTWSFVNGLPWARKMNRGAFTGKRIDGQDSSCARALKRVNDNRTA